MEQCACFATLPFIETFPCSIDTRFPGYCRSTRSLLDIIARFVSRTRVTFSLATGQQSGVWDQLQVVLSDQSGKIGCTSS